MKFGHSEHQIKCRHHVITDVPETHSSMQDKIKDDFQMSVIESSGNRLCVSCLPVRNDTAGDKMGYNRRCKENILHLQKKWKRIQNVFYNKIAYYAWTTLYFAYLAVVHEGANVCALLVFFVKAFYLQIYSLFHGVFWLNPDYNILNITANNVRMSSSLY